MPDKITILYTRITPPTVSEFADYGLGLGLAAGDAEETATLVGEILGTLAALVHQIFLEGDNIIVRCDDALEEELERELSDIGEARGYELMNF